MAKVVAQSQVNAAVTTSVPPVSKALYGRHTVVEDSNPLKKGARSPTASSMAKSSLYGRNAVVDESNPLASSGNGSLPLRREPSENNPIRKSIIGYDSLQDAKEIRPDELAKLIKSLVLVE